LKYIITSDTHFDFFFKEVNLTNQKIIKVLGYNKVLDYFEPKSEEPHTLIVAGDIGHYPEQNVKILSYLKKHFKYVDIIMVLGNHDYYNVSSSQRKYYKTLDAKETYALNLYRDSGMIVLNGDIIEHYGKKIMGFPAWYDATYLTRNGYINSIDSLWEYSMNDARLIPIAKGTGMYDLLKFQMDKVKDTPQQKVDIMITHFCPVVGDKYVDERYREEATNAFYQFDGEYLRDKFQPDVWVYGHTHEGNQFEEYGICYYCNPLGYPAEFKDRLQAGALKSIII